jgi:hypothetical protein
MSLCSADDVQGPASPLQLSLPQVLMPAGLIDTTTVAANNHRPYHMLAVLYEVRSMIDPCTSPHFIVCKSDMQLPFIATTIKKRYVVPVRSSCLFWTVGPVCAGAVTELSLKYHLHAARCQIHLTTAARNRAVRHEYLFFIKAR